MLMQSWDYLALDTIGYAQVGRPDYGQRIAVEKAVINTFFDTKEDLQVPKEFEYIARFRWTLCPHDFGSYWDFQLFYDRDMVELWEDDPDEETQDRFNRFWDWANRCESALSEYEEVITDMCDKLYQKEITMEIVYKRIGEIEDGLKAV